MTLAYKSAEQLRVMQRVIDRATLGVTLRDKITNMELKRKTMITCNEEDCRVKNGNGRDISQSKILNDGHLELQGEDQDKPKVASIDLPQKRSVYDIKQIAGRHICMENYRRGLCSEVNKSRLKKKKIAFLRPVDGPLTRATASLNHCLLVGTVTIFGRFSIWGLWPERRRKRSQSGGCRRISSTFHLRVHLLRFFSDPQSSFFLTSALLIWRLEATKFWSVDARNYTEIS